MSLIEITEVRKSFGTTEVLKGINLDVEAGEVIAIIGKSGSGKSTLLRCINGLETITDGSISVAGAQLLDDEVHLKALRLKVGMIFQQFNLFPHLTVGGNVMLSQTVVKKTPKAEAEATARKMLERVGLGHRFDAYPDELSGGQQQRVAIARAIVTEPALLLADEPTGNLDTKTSVEIMDLMTRLNREQGITIVMVTHEPDIAAYAQRLLRFVDGKLETEVEHRRRADHVL